MLNAESLLNEPSLPLDTESGYSMNAQMWHYLPKLIAAVKAGWEGYRNDPSHTRIDAMREEVELLLYWLARRVAQSHTVHHQDGDASRQMRVGAFGGHSHTELQHQIYEEVRGGKTITQLVEGAQDNFVNYLTVILSNRKTSLYRKNRTHDKYISPADDLLAAQPGEESHERAEDILLRPDQAGLSAQQCAEGLQCLEQFAAFIAAEKLKPQLEQVAWAMWMAAPLGRKDEGDISQNTLNTDRALAEEIGMNPKTFERYKPMARMLVKRFREKTGW